MVFYLQMIESEENRLKFRKIYDQYNSLLFYIAGKFFAKKQDAEDAVQDAYLAIIENLDNVGDENSNKTRNYVVTITENKCLDRLRKNRNILQADWDDATPGLEFEIPEETGLRAASIFLAILVGVSLFFALNTEARAAVRNWVRKEYDRFVVYQFYGEPQEGVLPDYEPTWIPEEYVEDKRFTDPLSKSIIYLNETTGDGIVFDYSYYETGLLQIFPSTEEGLHYEQTSIHGLPACYYYEADPTEFDFLIWIDDRQEIAFSVGTTLDRDTIFRIANNVRLKK